MKHVFVEAGCLLDAGSRAVSKCVNKARKTVNKAVVAIVAFLAISTGTFAQTLAGTDYTAGTSALETVATQVAAYVPYVVNLCYAIAGVVAVVGAISVYVAMNNEEQDVKKKIMMIVGACIFLIAAAQALPLFFGISN